MMSAQQGLPKDTEGDFDLPALDVSYDDALPPQLAADNVQEAIDKLKLAAGKNVFFWNAGKTWAMLYAELIANGNYGIVLLPSFSFATITDLGVGPYNLNNVGFVGLAGRSIIAIDPGVLLDAGAEIGLTFSNVFIFGQAPLMTPGSKAVTIHLDGCLLSASGSGPLFSTTSDNCELLGSRSSVGNDGVPVFDLTAPLARCYLGMSLGGYSPQVLSVYSSPIITGNAAASVAIITNALSQFDVFNASSGVIVEALGVQYGRLGFPNYTTPQLPAPTLYRRGNVSYDTLTETFVGGSLTENAPFVRWHVSPIKNGIYNATYFETVRCDMAFGAFQVFLPSAAGYAGYQVKFKNVTASVNALTINATGGETVDGAASIAMAGAFACFTFESDGANWMKVS
jgi:hypothetical protein